MVASDSNDRQLLERAAREKPVNDAASCLKIKNYLVQVS
jgi:hypothetical protein